MMPFSAQKAKLIFAYPMFLFMLGGSLVLGFGLFAAASYSEGTLLAARTAAQVIGWLLVLAAAAGAVALRQPNLGKATAASVALCSGLLLVYVANFEWSEVAHALPQRQELKIIEAPAPALAAAMGVKEIPVAASPTVAFEKPILTAAITTIAPKAKDACRDEVGLAWFFCQERARLEYCEGRTNDEPRCPSPIPAAYPG
jgi:hypothetical protein